MQGSFNKCNAFQAISKRVLYLRTLLLRQYRNVIQVLWAYSLTRLLFTTLTLLRIDAGHFLGFCPSGLHTQKEDVIYTADRTEREASNNIYLLYIYARYLVKLRVENEAVLEIIIQVFDDFVIRVALVLPSMYV